MNEYKAFARGVGLVGLVSLLSQFSSFISLPILTKTLPVDEYGTWALVIASISFIPRITMMGLPASMMRFLAASKDEKEIRKGFYSVTFYVLFSATTTAILILLFSSYLAWRLFNGEVTAVRLMAVIILIESMNAVFLSYFRTRQEMKRYSILLFIKAYLNVGMIAYFVLMGYGINGAVIGMLTSSSIIAGGGFILIVHEIGFSFKDRGNIIEYLRFGLPLVPSSLSNWIVNSSDRYLIGIIMGTAFVGYYSPAYSTGMLIVSILIGPVSIMLLPALSKHYDEKNTKAVTNILHYSTKYFLGLAIPAAVGVSLLSRQLLLILATKHIALEGYPIVPLVAASGISLGLYTILSKPISLRKKTKILGIIWAIAAGLNVGINLILIPEIGILGAAIATLVAYTFALASVSYFSLRFIPFKIDFVFLVKSIIASAVMAIPLIKIAVSGLVQTIEIATLSFLVYTSLMFLMKGFGREEITFFKELLRSSIGSRRSS